MSFSVRSSLNLKPCQKLCQKLCLTLALSSSLSLAQNAVSTGAMTGTVHDPGGQVVAHAAVTAINEATGERSTSSSNDVGLFSFPALKVGVYDVSVVSSGFKTVRIAGLVVAVGHTTDAEATLAIGEASDTVNVISDAGSALNPSDTTVGTLLQHDTIEGLPLSGRRYTDLVLLTPNVVADGQFGHISFAGQSGGDLSGYNNTAGGASNANGSTSFTVDGVDSTSYYYGDNRGFTRIPYVFGLQSIQEFQVQANVYDSSYGGAGAGFINTVTKSGTNKFHGDAFYYNRNSATGANDAIDKANGNPRPLNVLQQFGADIGGPVIKDKMFFYFDYEQQRHKDPLYAVNTGQAATNLQSFAPAGYTYAAGVTLPTPNSHYPVAATISQNDATADPTNPIYLQGVANALNVIHSNLGPRARRRDDWELFPKFDWAISEKTHLTALYNYNHFQSAGGIITFSPESFGGDELLGDNGVRDHVATVHLTHTFSPSIVNDAYVSYVRDEQLYHPSGLAATPTSPQIVLLAPQTLLLGNPTFTYNNLREYQTQFADHVTFLHGKNQLDAGYSLNYDTISDDDPGTFYGQYVFFSLQSFALGKWGVFNQTAGNPKYNFSDPFMGFFVNDTYHLRPNLTVTGGIREDFQKYGNPAGNPLVPSTQKFNNQYQRISPRVGFSYNPFAKTVIRGGAGLYYEIFVGGNYQRSTQQDGVSQTSVSGFDAFTAASLDTIAANQSPSFPAAVPANDPRFAGGGSIVTVDSHYKTPSVVNASLQIDQEIAKGTILTVGSLWSHGMHLTSSTAYDQNLNAPTGTTTYRSSTDNSIISVEPNLDPGVLGEGRLTASLGQINALISPGIDNYNSLFVQLNRQASHDINFILSYTFAKSTQSGVDFYNQFDFSGTHGLSVLDQRQRFSIAGVYAPTLGTGSEFARAAADGWRVSLIAQVNTGHPYTGVIGSLNDTAELQATANTAAGLVGGNSPGYGLAPGDGINSFTGPGTAQVDLGIERAIKIKETQSVTLKVQSFNLLNSANYFVYAGSGINQVQYNTSGATCGDGKTLNQTCILTPNTGVGGFQTLTAVDQSHPPRIFQFSFAYKF